MDQIRRANNQQQNEESYIANKFQNLDYKYYPQTNQSNQSHHISNVYQPSAEIIQNQDKNNNNFQAPNNNQSSAFNNVFQMVNGVHTANFDDVVKYNNSLKIQEIQPKSVKISRIIETTAPNPQQK